MSKGFLKVSVYVNDIANPISNAEVEIEGLNITLATDENGQTPLIELEAPDENYSNEPQDEVQPFATYNVLVRKAGFVPTTINNVQIYSDITSFQDVYLVSIDETTNNQNIINVDDPTLWGEYAPKLLDDESPKLITAVLPIVYIPSHITVHNGIPSNTNAAKYRVSFVDYIKNVACSEIYATWPKETIKANVAAIVSFTLNRIFTEWYLSKGYNFTITASTIYDQKYTHGRTIFDSISKIVDEIFTEYIVFPNRIEPFLAHYNDGIKLNNKGWLSQWGSKTLGDKGYKALDILKYYYGSTLTIKSAPIFEGFPTSFPGYNLRLDACGEEVQKIQNELNKIRGSYPGIPVINKPNGIFDKQTENAVKTFQKVFNLSVTGIIDFATWYKISHIYTAVTKMTESIY